eukprot:6192697-Pleurochrysis_carterae.AAC.3
MRKRHHLRPGMQLALCGPSYVPLSSPFIHAPTSRHFSAEKNAQRPSMFTYAQPDDFVHSPQSIGTWEAACARTFQWACYFHVLYQHRRYSPKFAGRLVGYGNMVIAIIGNGPPSLLNFFVADATAVLDSVGNRYIAVHVGLLAVMTLACVALPFHLHRTR